MFPSSDRCPLVAEPASVTTTTAGGAGGLLAGYDEPDGFRTRHFGGVTND
jgi:hypothetical protein